MEIMKRIILQFVLFTGITNCSFAQKATIFSDIHPQKTIADFVLPPKLTVTKTIHTYSPFSGQFGICSRANEHIFVYNDYNTLLCYNTKSATQIGPLLSSELVPHFDGINDLACLVRLAIPKNENQPYAIMYHSGLIRHLPYTDCEPDGFVDGLAVVSDGKDHYLIDHYGNIKAKGYNRIGPLRDNRRPVCKSTFYGNKWGYIDSNCKVIVEPKYIQVGIFSDNVAWVLKDITKGPIIINQFGSELHSTNPLFAGIKKAYDFIRGEALVMFQKEDWSFENKIIDKTGLPLVFSNHGDWDHFWLTDFDNEHAEYFFEVIDEEGAPLYGCSTKGNIVRGIEDFSRGDALSWEGFSNGYRAWHPTAVSRTGIFDPNDPDGHFYTENHIIWRCLNPIEEGFFFHNEFDGIALWSYKDETFISSSIRKSEKTELGGEFTNVVRIVTHDEPLPYFSTSNQSIGTAPLPNYDTNSDEATDEDGILTSSSGNTQNQDGDGDNGDGVKASANTLIQSLMGNGVVEISANGTAISSGEEVAIGTQVTIICTPKEGGKVSAVKLNGTIISTIADGNVYTATFQMPPAVSVISVEFTGGSK